MKTFNDWLGNKLSYGLSTMVTFYIISTFVLIPLLFQRPHDLVGWVQYIVQSFFQGVALPVLAYVARIAGERQELVLKETHDIVMEELNKHSLEMKELKYLHKCHHDTLKEMKLLNNNLTNSCNKGE